MEPELPLHQGLTLIREMLGDDAADRMEQNASAGFGARFSQLAIEFAFGTLWAESDLARRDLSLVTIGALVATRQFDELAHHVRIGMGNGLTAEEIEQAITHLAAYTGFPAARCGLATVRTILEQSHSD